MATTLLLYKDPRVTPSSFFPSLLIPNPSAAQLLSNPASSLCLLVATLVQSNRDPPDFHLLSSLCFKFKALTMACYSSPNPLQLISYISSLSEHSKPVELL